MNKHTALIDIGSNSVRLVIYENRGELGFHEIENVKIFAQLRRYVGKTGNIGQAGIRKLLDALTQFKEIMGQYPIGNTICGATATIRQAKNQDAILQTVREKTGFSIKIISEHDEAYNGYQAIVNSTPLTTGLTVDMGGGSTEISLVRNRRFQEFHSFPFGAVTLKQQFIQGNLPTKDEMKAITQFIKDQLSTLPWLSDLECPIVAIGGSARNMARAHQMLTKYPLAIEHFYEMGQKDLDSVQNALSSLSFEELQQADGIAKERADTILPAIELFRILGETVSIPGFFLSRKGFRDGLVAPDDKILTIEEVKTASIRNSVPKFPAPDIAERICASLPGVDFTEEDLQLLRYGLPLYNIGQFIDPNMSLQHSFYYVANRTFEGFTHKEHLALALLASYHSKSQMKNHLHRFHDWFSKEERHKINILGSVIKLVENLKFKGELAPYGVTVSANSPIRITFQCDHCYPHLIEEANKQKKHLERALKQEIRLIFP